MRTLLNLKIAKRQNRRWLNTFTFLQAAQKAAFLFYMKNFFLTLACFSWTIVSAQNERITDHNSIAWLQSFATVRLSKKIDWLSDVQWRRTEGLASPQQLLLRSGIQYRLNTQVSLAAGYAWIETYPYGDYPIAANGTFPERRTHQQVVLKQSLESIAITQRIRTEQRWIGRINANDPDKIEDWVFSNRFRYQLRLQKQFRDSSKLPIYGAIANEVFINAGKNVGINIFDQNRLQVLLGVRLSSHISIETGYIKQTLQQGRRTPANKTVVQNNDGATLSLLFQL